MMEEMGEVVAEKANVFTVETVSCGFARRLCWELEA